MGVGVTERLNEEKPEGSKLLNWTSPDVFYEVMLNRRLVYECQCDERLKSKVEESAVIRHTSHTLGWGGTGTPKDRDEVNRREVWECDGWVCYLEVTGTSSVFKVICKGWRKSGTIRIIVRYLRNWSVSVLEGSRTSDWENSLNSEISQCRAPGWRRNWRDWSRV